MAEQDNSQVKAKNGELTRWVTFHLDREVYGINVMQVQEVLRYSEIAPVPGSPDYVLGIINLRGNVVTVIDTRMRFGIEPMEVTDSSRIVIIEAGGQVVGILVDSVAEVAKRHGVSEATIYVWRKKFGSMETDEPHLIMQCRRNSGFTGCGFQGSF